jgi:DNA polymerase III alpha subunit
LLFINNETFIAMTASDPKKPDGTRFPVQKIPPSHDYIRQHGSAAPAEPRAQEAPDPPVYGDIHKFGYTRPLKKHEQPASETEAGPEAENGPGADPSPPFVHLHVHSNFSFLDGGSRIEDLVARAAELGQPALALTDHDGLYGAVRFAKACAKRGIKPIFGAEVRVESLLGATWAAGGRRPESPRPAGTGDDPGQSDPGRGATDDPHHLVLLAETREGYANLCRLLSAAHLADPERQHPPLVTLESLRTHAEGLICLTGCRHGEIGYLIDTGRATQAEAALLLLRDIFGPHHLYVELQYFGYEPHQEARAGQHGAAVFKKAPAIGNRLRHEQVPTPAGAETPVAVDPLSLRYYCIATTIASWWAKDGCSPPLATTTARAVAKAAARTDLPQGHPQRLNPSDYDVGFHRDDRPWRLSCLTYCLQLVALARARGLPTVLTTNAHYARGSDRAVHLICRAAGHDKPLSGYPDPAPGARCLSSKSELETLAAPLLGLIDSAGRPADAAPHSAIMHYDFTATDIALYGAPPGQADRADDLLSCAPMRFVRSDKPHRRPEVVAQHAPTQPRGAVALAAPAPAPTSAPFPSPLAATAAIAARCSVDLELGTYHFPKVEVPRGETAYSLLAKRCFRGIARRYRPVPPRAVELLEKELRMIQQMGFAHYFLVVHDIVRWARAKGVACSGRGSAGNSIVCHVLDITASEPIRHNLLFERFLNPNRREMPDIDIDFCSSRRDEVIEHIYKTFGNENVAVVANINTMSPRSAVRIVAEALGYAPTEINALAKHVPRHGDAARIREYLAGAWPELRDSPLQDSAPAVPPADGALGRPEGRYAKLLDLVERLDSFPMHLGTHLGGFVITDRPITYYAPLQWAAKGVVVIQFNKDDVAALGLVKMDILGLRTHSAVSECVHLIRQRTGRRIRPYDLPPDDPAAYEIVSNGGSIGLFQLESAGQRNLASRLQERDFDDVIAAIALYRPGPLEAEMIGPFIDRRWGIEPVVLPHPAMAEAVADTYGVILYQEQVLRIAQSVAGFDLADADSLRRAMTRDRSREEMAKIGETFISGALARGVPEDAAREVFRQLEGFAAYGFNKSHSVCFAVIAYATAWLKAYYPAEFLCSILNNYPMGFYTPRTVLNDARRFGLQVRPIDINLSGRGFTVEDEQPPEVWGDRGYNPFAQAWTAEHGWGLTEADLAELAAEQDGDQAYAEALQAALQHPASDGDHRDGAKNAPSGPGGATPPAASPSPVTQTSPSGREAPPPPTAAAGRRHPGDLLLPRAPRARGGVEPGACLAPSTGIAPDAGRALRVGLSYLKQMGERTLDRIEEERRHGPFESFEDFYLRTRIDSAVAENLIRVGAFDSLEPDRTELLWRLPLLHDRLEALAGSTGQRRGQLRAFFSPPSRAGLMRSWSLEDKVRSELELLGLTVSCHPLKLYEEELRRMGVRMSYELPAMGDEVPVLVAGVYERAQNPWMRSGKRTMFLTLEDAYGLFECVCFEKRLARIAPVVARASYFLVRGRLQNNHKRGLAIVAEEVFDLEEVLARRRERRPKTAAASSRTQSPMPDSVDMIGQRETETFGDETASPKHRALGAGNGAISKKVG